MKQMQIEQYVVGPIQTNCYFIIHKETKALLVVDPGASGARLAAIAKEKGYTPVAILLTHGHFDHADGIADFVAAFPESTIPVYAHEQERDTLADATVNVSAMMGSANTYHADVFVRDHETLALAGFSIEVLHTPGHTVGGCCYYFPEEAAVFCGDSLFAGSIGRTDFPGGSESALIGSVREKVLSLPEETDVFPGHNETTTVGREKRYNPFFA